MDMTCRHCRWRVGPIASCVDGCQVLGGAHLACEHMKNILQNSLSEVWLSDPCYGVPDYFIGVEHDFGKCPVGNVSYLSVHRYVSIPA